MIAVMACITVNGTLKLIPNPWSKAIPTDPTPLAVDMKLAQLEEAVRTQAEKIEALEQRERRLINLLRDTAAELRQIPD